MFRMIEVLLKSIDSLAPEPPLAKEIQVPVPDHTARFRIARKWTIHRSHGSYRGAWLMRNCPPP